MKPRHYVIGLAALMLLGSIPLMVPADTVIDSISIATSDSNADGKADSASVTVLVDNHNPAAPPTTITVKAKLFPPGKAANPASADFISSDQKTVNNPAPMALSSFVLNLAATTNSGIGSYTVLIEESNDGNTGNNYQTTIRSITLYQLDLTGGFLLSVNQAGQVALMGQNATFTFSVWNRGTSPDNYTITVPAVPGGWLASSDLSTVMVNDGDTGTFNVTVTAPIVYWGGAWYLDLSVSARSQASSETKNNTIRATMGKPELNIHPADLGLSVANPVPGQTLDLLARFQNNGTVAAYNVKVTFSVEGIEVGNVTVPSIDAGGAYKLVNLAWVAKAGPFTLYVSVEPQSNISEFDPTDNWAAVHFLVRAPDLVSAYTDFSTSPAVLTAGTAATLSLLVHNTGGADATAFMVRIVIDTFTQDQNVAGIPANGSAVVNFTYTVAQGAQDVHVFLDYADTVGEENEFDNNVTFQLHYNIPPVAVLTAVNDSVTLGKPVIFRTTGSYDNDGTIVNYRFFFGDHNYRFVNTTSGTSYIYQHTGNFTVTLIVTDNNGAQSANATMVVTVSAAPVQPATPGFGLLAVLAAAGAVSVLAGQRKRK